MVSQWEAVTPGADRIGNTTPLEGILVDRSGYDLADHDASRAKVAG